MVKIPIYSDSESSTKCEYCRNKVQCNDHLKPCLNTTTNIVINVCTECIEKYNHILPVDECMPSGDVVM